jgi:hypothetical protein
MKPQSKPQAPPLSLHEVAEDNLRYIRATMESSTVFTGVSGKGYMAAGTLALIAAWIAARQTSDNAWLAVWMIELVLGAGIAFYLSSKKAQSLGSSVWSSSGRKLLLAFLPAMAVGGMLTIAFYLHGTVQLLPGIWLSLYGAATMTAGLWSIRIIPLMGAVFLALGAIVMFSGVSADLILAAGFGGVHIGFGLLIWRKYGG